MRNPDGRPQVVAHRGASDVRAEHTLGAYVQALDEGADGLEADVRLTADGHLVCVHDRRTERTTGSRGVVSTMRLADLDVLDASAWKNPWGDLNDEAEDTDFDQKRVLSLRRLLEVTSSYERRVELAIETKHPTRYAGLVERRLVETLREFGWTGKDSPVRMMSFSAVAVTRVTKMAPDLEVVLLIKHAPSWKKSRAMLRPGWVAGPGMDLVRERPRLVRTLREDGHRVHVWTVNTREDLELCIDLGVEAVITDRPARVISWLSAV